LDDQQSRAKESVSEPHHLAVELDTYLSRTAPFGFSGAVLLALDGDMVLEQGYGLAERERLVPVTAETAFDIASCTKWFTAAGILKLEEEGKLTTSDSIARFFDGVPPEKAAITIHHLLTHTAGLPLYSGPDEEYVTRDEMVGIMLRAELESAPGAEYSYSNPGYGLLGAIIELVAGQSYESYLHDDLFAPAGMFHTGYVIPRWEPDAISHLYDGERHVGTPHYQGWGEGGPGWHLHANGGMLSTVGDFYRWHVALHRGELLSEESLRKMFTPYAEATGSLPVGSFTGYGVEISETTRGTKLITRDGTGSYFAATYRHYPDDGVVLIVLGNCHRFVVRMVEARLTDAIFNDVSPVPPPERRLRTAPDDLQRYCGRYALSSGAEFEVTVRGDALYIEPVGQEAFDLFGTPQPHESKVRAYQDLNDRTVAIIDASRRGDFGPLEAVTPAERFTARKQLMERLFGHKGQDAPSAPGHRVLGSTLSLFLRPADAIATNVEVKSDADTDYLTFFWQDGGLLGMTEILTDPMGTLFVAQTHVEFAGFNLAVQRPIQVRFEFGERDNAIRLSVLAGSKEHLADRIQQPSSDLVA